MAGRERMRLTDTAIARLCPHEREYTVWDSRVAGLGVRVRPTGGRSWVLLLDAGGRSKRVSLGPVSTKSVEEVRRECHARKANLEPGRMESAARPVPLFRDFVAGTWKEAHIDGHKPSTREHLVSVGRPDSADFRVEAAGPHCGGRHQMLVRPVQPDRAGQCQSLARPPSADLELRRRLRPHRNQSHSGHHVQPATETHAVPVPGRGYLPPPCPGCADPAGKPAASRHHPPSAAHRMPQGRDRQPQMVRSS